MADTFLHGAERGSLSQSFLEGLALRTEPARHTGTITPLEDYYDPNVHGNDGVRARFRDTVLTAPVLDEFETAIDLGLCIPCVIEEAPEFMSYWAPWLTAADLMACRAASYAWIGDHDRALATAERLWRLALALDEERIDPFLPGGSVLAKRTHAAVGCVLAAGTIPEETRARFLEYGRRRCDPKRFAEKLRVYAVEVLPQSGIPSAHVGEVAANIIQYEFFGQVTDVVPSLERPLYEWRQELLDVAYRHSPLPRDPSSAADTIQGAADAVVSQIGSREAVERQYLAEELVRICESYARDCRTPSLLATAFALEDYKAAEGNYPETLDALVPNLIEAVPVDPLSGDPLEHSSYRRGLRVVPSLHRRPGERWGCPLAHTAAAGRVPRRSTDSSRGCGCGWRRRRIGETGKHGFPKGKLEHGSSSPRPDTTPA